MLRIIFAMICLLPVLVASPLTAQGAVNFHVTGIWGGAYLGAAFNTAETVFILAQPSGVELFDLTEDNIPSTGLFALPGTTSITIQNDLLAVAHYSQDREAYQISLIDVAAAEVIQSGILAGEGEVNKMALSPDTSMLAVLYAAKLVVVETRTGALVGDVVLDETVGVKQGLAWSDDGRFLAVARLQLLIYEPGLDAVVFQSDFLNTDLSLLFADDAFIAYDSRSSTVWKWNAETGELETLTIQRANPQYYFSLSISSKADYLIVTEARDSRLVPLSSEAAPIARADAEITADTWSAGGTFAFRSGNNPPRFRLFTFDEHMRETRFGEIEAHLFSYAWSPADHFLSYLSSLSPENYTHYAFYPVVVDLSQPGLPARIIERPLLQGLAPIYSVTEQQITLMPACGLLTVDFGSQLPTTDFLSGCGDGGDSGLQDGRGSANGFFRAETDERGRIFLYGDDPNSATYNHLLQTLETHSGAVNVRFAGRDVLYSVGADGRVIRYQNQ